MKVHSEMNGFNDDVEKERRAVPRVSKKDTIQCIAINSEKCFYLFKCVNISTQGIGFISPREFKKDDFLEVIILFDKSISIQLLVRIVRNSVVDEGFFIGAEFVGMPSSNYEILKSILDGYLDNI